MRRGIVNQAATVVTDLSSVTRVRDPTRSRKGFKHFASGHGPCCRQRSRHGTWLQPGEGFRETHHQICDPSEGNFDGIPAPCAVSVATFCKPGRVSEVARGMAHVQNGFATKTRGSESPMRHCEARECNTGCRGAHRPFTCDPSEGSVSRVRHPPCEGVARKCVLACSGK